METEKMNGGTFLFKKTLLVILIVLSVFFRLYALDPEAPVDQYLVDEWNAADGLAADNVMDITQTPDGYLWFGTYDGLARFDGLKFETFGFSQFSGSRNEAITSLYVDRNETLWVGRFLGLGWHRDGKFDVVTESDGLPGKPISAIVEDMNGRILVGVYDDGLYRLDGTKFKKFEAPGVFNGKQISAVLEDSRGILWICAGHEGLFQLRNGSFEKIELDIPGPSFRVWKMVEDSSGILWVSTDKGLVRLDGKNRELIVFAEPGLALNNILVLLEDKDKNLWVGTRGGLFRISPTDPDAIQGAILFKNQMITRIYEDREANIWVATSGSGIKRIRNPVFKLYTAKHGLNNDYIWSLFQDRDGAVWAGTNDALYRFEDGIFRRVSTGSGNAKYAIAQCHSGELWLGTESGLIKNPGKNQVHFTQKDGLIWNTVAHLYCDRQNRLWAGTTDGLCCYRDGSFKRFATDDGLPGHLVNSFYEDRNHDVWVTTCSGLIRFRKGKISRENADIYLKGVACSFIMADGDNSGFWIGSFGDGLIRFNGEKSTFVTMKHGLASRHLYQAVRDESGNLWLSSDKGVLRINEKDLDMCGRGKKCWLDCAAFGVADGLKCRECSWSTFNSVIKTREGELWFATKKGIAVLRPDRVRLNKQPPPVVIEQVAVDDQTFIPAAQTVVRFPALERVTFAFTAPSFIAPANIRFKYKLEGYDEKWRVLPLDASRKAVYTGLPDGRYRFQVKAGNRDGVWNHTGDWFSFQRTTPFIKTAYFKAIIFMTCLALVAAPGFLLMRWFKKSFIRRSGRYDGSSLDPDRSDIILKKLNYLMSVEKAYQDEDLTLGDLAGRLDVPLHFLSQLINEKLGKNFFALVNGYRVEEVEKRLADPLSRDVSILAIAYDAGFSTKSSFNRTFKKHTGMTPSEYRKKNTGKREINGARRISL
jgi:ligand-binding sensor domain-containing protein/AraC-like DNA-binding protein